MTSANEDWTPEAAIAIQLCKQWAECVRAEIDCDIFLFGSAIYKGGDQFDPQLSDLDIVVMFNEDLTATERVERLTRLREFKHQLELQIIPNLHRTNCVDPGVSVVPITRIELQANIHKSGARSFFERNIFLNLGTENQSVGLPDAGVVALPEESRQALEYAQKIRNQFLAISGNHTGGIGDFEADDPLPKALARVAAQLVPDPEEGEWYDTRRGLEYLCDELARRRSESASLQSLYKSISVRRGGKGRRRSLSDLDQLLLAEVLHDLASSIPAEPVITWEIRFSGGDLTGRELDQVLRKLSRLVPDARIVMVRPGSIIVRLRSSKHSYDTVRELHALGVLSKLFAVSEVNMSAPGDMHGFEGFDAKGPVDRIADRIAKWRPRASDNFRQAETDLASWLALWLQEQPELAEWNLSREVAVGAGPRPPRVDFLLRVAKTDEQLIIELVRLRTRSSFFQRLEYILQLGLPTIFVVVGSPGQLESLNADIERLAELSGQVRVVSVPLYDE